MAQEEKPEILDVDVQLANSNSLIVNATRVIEDGDLLPLAEDDSAENRRIHHYVSTDTELAERNSDLLGWLAENHEVIVEGCRLLRLASERKRNVVDQAYEDSVVSDATVIHEDLWEKVEAGQSAPRRAWSGLLKTLGVQREE